MNELVFLKTITPKRQMPPLKSSQKALQFYKNNFSEVDTITLVLHTQI